MVLRGRRGARFGEGCVAAQLCFMRLSTNLCQGAVARVDPAAHTGMAGIDSA
jgi:hypothetical protein